MKRFALICGALLIASTAPAEAQGPPYNAGTYWDVDLVAIEEGKAPDYMDYLPRQWLRDQEFAKSRGWIKNYRVLRNLYAREGEPDLYLIVEFDRLATPDEERQRLSEYLAFAQRNARQVAEASGERGKLRTLKGSILLQELHLKPR